MNREIVAVNVKGDLCVLIPLVPEQKNEYVCHQDEQIGWRISTVIDEPAKPIIYLIQISRGWGLIRWQEVENMTLLGDL
jgi:hypothetical protein